MTLPLLPSVLNFYIKIQETPYSKITLSISNIYLTQHIITHTVLSSWLNHFIYFNLSSCDFDFPHYFSSSLCLFICPLLLFMRWLDLWITFENNNHKIRYPTSPSQILSHSSDWNIQLYGTNSQIRTSSRFWVPSSPRIMYNSDEMLAQKARKVNS